MYHQFVCTEGKKNVNKALLYCCKNNRDNHIRWYINDTGICPKCGKDNSDNPRVNSPTND